MGDGKNGVFIPLGLFASDDVISWKKGMMEQVVGQPPSECTGKYDNYFTLESIEIKAEGSDPKVSHFGFCTDTMLGTVGVFMMFMGAIQFSLTALSLNIYMEVSTAGKVDPQYQ